MKCPLCRGQMVRDKTNLPYEIDGDRLIVIRDVPASVCRQCGESFIDIAVARVVERIVATAEKDGVTLGFIQYSEAA